MGAACARTLSKENYKLVLMSRTENVLELASDLNAVGMVGDVTNQNDLSKVVDLALDSYGQIDAIVNNTGHPPKGDLLKITDSEWKEAFDLLLLNVVRISRLVVPIMKKMAVQSLIYLHIVQRIQIYHFQHLLQFEQGFQPLLSYLLISMQKMVFV